VRVGEVRERAVHVLLENLQCANGEVTLSVAVTQLHHQASGQAVALCS
jgi:hypothetical protein